MLLLITPSNWNKDKKHCLQRFSPNFGSTRHLNLFMIFHKFTIINSMNWYPIHATSFHQAPIKILLNPELYSLCCSCCRCCFIQIKFPKIKVCWSLCMQIYSRSVPFPYINWISRWKYTEWHRFMNRPLQATITTVITPKITWQPNWKTNRFTTLSIRIDVFRITVSAAESKSEFLFEIFG